MVVYHGNRAEKIRLGTAKTLAECCAIMNDYLTANEIKSTQYRRYFENEGLIQVDYGSWSNFFFIGGISVEKFLGLEGE